MLSDYGFAPVFKEMNRAVPSVRGSGENQPGIREGNFSCYNDGLSSQGHVQMLHNTTN